MTLTSFNKKRKIIIGIDEAGRGPWAGPVVAASVLFKNDDIIKPYYEKINDSKKISEKQREFIFQQILEDDNIEYNYAVIANEIIDETNILRATKLAMKTSLAKHKYYYSDVLVDGNQTFDYENKNIKAIIGGDGIIREISTASIIAKCVRDNIMKDIAKEYPSYGFEKHKGYGTKLHKEAIEKYGACKYHRYSFKPIKEIEARK
ncbi:MAG: ribonuclease HII [Rickettsiales bacterium]|nr:ribonuclease HII [Rickettsiales bacterium]